MSEMFSFAGAFNQNLADWCDNALMNSFSDYSNCDDANCGADGDDEQTCNGS